MTCENDIMEDGDAEVYKDWGEDDKGGTLSIAREKLVETLENNHQADAVKHSLHSWFNFALNLVCDPVLASVPPVEGGWEWLFTKNSAVAIFECLLPPDMTISVGSDGLPIGEYALPFDSKEYDTEGDRVGKQREDASYLNSGAYKAAMDIPWKYIQNPATRKKLIFFTSLNMQDGEREIAEEVVNAIHLIPAKVKIPPLPSALPIESRDLADEVDRFYASTSKQRFWAVKEKLREYMEGVPFGLMNFALRWHLFNAMLKDALLTQGMTQDDPEHDITERWLTSQMRSVIEPEDDLEPDIIGKNRDGEAIHWSRFTDSEKRRLIPAMARLMSHICVTSCYDPEDYEEEMRAAAGMRECDF